MGCVPYRVQVVKSLFCLCSASTDCCVYYTSVTVAAPSAHLATGWLCTCRRYPLSYSWKTVKVCCDRSLCLPELQVTVGVHHHPPGDSSPVPASAAVLKQADLLQNAPFVFPFIERVKVPDIFGLCILWIHCREYPSPTVLP